MTNYVRMYRFGITPWERYATAAAASIAALLDREEAERSGPLGRAGGSPVPGGWLTRCPRLVPRSGRLLGEGLFRTAAACDQRLFGGQGRPLNSGWSPGAGSVNRQPKNGDATALWPRMLSPAGRWPVVIQDTRAEKPADSSLVV